MAVGINHFISAVSGIVGMMGCINAVTYKQSVRRNKEELPFSYFFSTKRTSDILPQMREHSF